MDKSKIKILVVDDEKDITEGLKVNLEMDGFKVATANSAATALKLIEETQYQIVLSDINMPEMDGLELLEEIKKLRGETIVIMITAYTSLMKVVTSRIYGATDYILKPFRDFDELEEVITRACQQVERWSGILEETRKVKTQVSP